MCKFSCVSGVFSDGNSVLAKVLVIQEVEALTCTSGRPPSPVPGSGCLSCLTREWGQPAYLCPSHPGCSFFSSLTLFSSLRVKALRKQAARRPEGVDSEDPVMGTIAWVSDVGVFSCSGSPGHVHSVARLSSSVFPAPPWSSLSMCISSQ